MLAPLVASLHRHEKSPFWYVAFTLPNGRRVFRSTRQTDRKKAAEVMRTIERAEGAARQDALTESHVRKWMDELLESTGMNRVRTFTVREFCAEWLAGKQLSVNRSTALRLERALRLLTEGLGPRADKPLLALTSSDITAYRNARLRDNIAPGTLGHYLKAVRSMLSAARRQGLILTNPAEAVELPRRRAHERTTFSTQELGALLLAAEREPEWQTLILLGFYTGGRLMDLARLRWDAVDLTARVISYTQAKTSSKITVPIHSELAQHLFAIAGDAVGPVCPVLSRMPSIGRHGLSKQFIKLMEQAGIDPQQVKNSKHGFSAKSFHALRHSFASALANAGVTVDLRMKLTGHSSLEVHKGYTHHELETLRGAIQALPPLK